MGKTVTLTNLQIANGYAALDVLIAKEMETAPGWSIFKNKATLTPHAKDYHEYRQKILKRLARLDERGNPLTEDRKILFETPEAEAMAVAEIDELMAIEVTVEIRTIALAALRGVKIAPEIFEVLEWMIVEEEAAKEEKRVLGR